MVVRFINQLEKSPDYLLSQPGNPTMYGTVREADGIWQSPAIHLQTSDYSSSECPVCVNGCPLGVHGVSSVHRRDSRSLEDASPSFATPGHKLLLAWVSFQLWSGGMSVEGEWGRGGWSALAAPAALPKAAKLVMPD